MRRWAAAITAAVLTVVSPAVAVAKFRGTDVWGNLAPVGSGNHLADKYPLSFYGLDYHVDGPSVGLGGVNTGDVPAMIAQFIASLLFQVSTWLVSIVLDIFDWAFSVDLLGGANGALSPIGHATQGLYQNTLGPAFLTAGVVLLGMWAIHKGLVQRRFSDATSGIAVSVLLVVVATLLILKPEATIGTASQMTNQMSNALLAGATATGDGDARGHAEDHLFETFVYDPWVVMEFGGLKHCVSSEHDKDGFPKPVAPNDPARTTCRDHLRAHDGFGGYAPRFLESPPGSDERDQMYEALKDGQANDAWPGWRVDKADAPAVDIQQAGGSFQRLALAALVFIATLGAVLLLGMLAFAALLAQVIALALLAFAPAVLLCALFPGWGHKLFRSWLAKLLTAVFIKVVYSLVLAILIAVSLALDAAAGNVGYLFAFGLQAAFFWAVFLKRKALAGVMLTDRETTRIERTTREAVATPVATAVGAGWAGGVSAARRWRSKDGEVEDEHQEHVPRPGRSQPGTSPQAPAEEPYQPLLNQAKPVKAPSEEAGEVEREPAAAPEPARAGRGELAPALEAAKEKDTERVQPTIAQTLEAARTPPSPASSAEDGGEQLSTAYRQDRPGQEQAVKPAGSERLQPSAEPAQEPVRRVSTMKEKTDG